MSSGNVNSDSIERDADFNDELDEMSMTADNHRGI